MLGCVLDLCHADATAAECGGLVPLAVGDSGGGSLELGAAVALLSVRRLWGALGAGARCSRLGESERMMFRVLALAVVVVM